MFVLPKIGFGKQNFLIELFTLFALSYGILSKVYFGYVILTNGCKS